MLVVHSRAHRRRFRLVGCLTAVIALGLAGGGGAVASTAAGQHTVRPSKPTAHHVAREVPSGLHPAAARQPSSTARGAEFGAGVGAATPAAVSRSWQGIYDPSDWPTAPSSAIGPSRYVEVINDVINTGYAIYDRTHDAPLVSGPLYDLVSCGDSNCYNTTPSVIWDPTSKRFFYVAESLPAAPGLDGHLMFGFSKTSTPGAGNTWCHYQLDVGANFADRPQLGDSTNFFIMGYDVYDGSTEKFVGARLAAYVKPSSAPITTCPSSLKGGPSGNLTDPSGHNVFAPAPANEIDADGSGWVLARAFTLPSSSLVAFQVTRAASGLPTFHTVGSDVAVPSYKAGTAAAQPGVPYTIDTGYAGPTHPVAAIDPLRGDADRVWVSQTVAGGGGSVVRWFEIDPVADKTLQSGTVSYPHSWAFNGAISPDRVNNGATQAFGANMVLTFDTSSSTALPSVYERGKVGNSAMTPAVKILSANGADIGADCRGSDHICQWGGGAASPDPAASPAGQTGSIWSVQMISAKGADGTDSSGMSWNLAASP